MTVAWMVSVMTTTVCGAIAALVLLAVGVGANPSGPELFGRLLHFSALVAAVVSLLLLAVVLKVRSQPPPQSIVWFAVVVALATIGAAFLY